MSMKTTIKGALNSPHQAQPLASSFAHPQKNLLMLSLLHSTLVRMECLPKQCSLKRLALGSVLGPKGTGKAMFKRCSPCTAHLIKPWPIFCAQSGLTSPA